MLVRFDPFRDLDRLTQSVWSGGSSRPLGGVPIDAYRQGDEFVVEFDLPGVDPASVELTVERNVLTVSAERPRRWAEGARVIVNERPAGRFSRRIALGDTLDADRVSARSENGVLTVTVPVAERAKPRRVEIAAGAGPAIDGPAIEVTAT